MRDAGAPSFFVGGHAASTKTSQELSVLQLPLLIRRRLTPETFKLRRKKNHAQQLPTKSQTRHVNWLYR